MSSKLGVMDEEMEGEASELILFIFILKLLYNYSIYYSFLNCYIFILFNVFYIKASKLILDDVEDFGVGRFSKSTMSFYPLLE